MNGGPQGDGANPAAVADWTAWGNGVPTPTALSQPPLRLNIRGTILACFLNLQSVQARPVHTALAPF